MKKCPKCGDPVRKDETFCGKCGTPIPVGKAGSPADPAQNVPPASVPLVSPQVQKIPAGQAQTAPVQKVIPSQSQVAPTASKASAGFKKWLWIIVAAVAIVIILLILYFSGVLGGSAAVKKYIKTTGPDFKTVVSDVDLLEHNLTYEVNATTKKEYEEYLSLMKAEIDDVKKLKSDVDNANRNRLNLKVSNQVKDLDGKLGNYYKAFVDDLDVREKTVNYFYQSQKIADKMETAGGASGSQATDVQQLINSLQQLKFALDSAIAEMQEMDVPDAISEVHKVEVEMSKQMSTVLNDMILALQRYDDVGFLSAVSRFDALLSDYNTKTAQKYKEILKPEFDRLNETLKSQGTLKDQIEDVFSKLSGKYQIEMSVFKFLK